MAVSGEACHRQGCSGVIVDGFCSDCGRPPVGASSAVRPGSSPAPGVPVGHAAPPEHTGSGKTGSSPSGISGKTSSTGSARSSRGSTGSKRRGLGVGLVEVQPLPTVDPMGLIMADPVVPPDKRYCGSCQKRVNLTKGFCPSCGAAYSFEPTVRAGDMVAGQYEVKGALAFGGLGWIYLGFDTVLQRWVVLKGLLNTKDEASAQAAVQEKRFLAEVKHPNIVGVYNFVNNGAEGYIVMEFVGGKTLKTMRKERGPLPVLEACAYMLRILGAFGYLHRQGLVYCDFKPDNCMLEGEDIKLIDMGGVRRIDDTEGYVYGTRGYSAPEAGDEPTPSSDLYTVARSLAVLIHDFKFQGQYEYTLPTPAEAPIFAQHESLYNLLLTATRKDRDWRFQAAEEMAEQLIGVMRQIASENGEPHPSDSLLFNRDRLEMQHDEVGAASHKACIEALPTLKVDTTDTGANFILSVAGTTDAARQVLAFSTGLKQYPDSIEIPLRLSDVLLATGDAAHAEQQLKAIETKDPFDWRPWWIRGIALLRSGSPQPAAVELEKVCAEIPGELAPKLALAAALEKAGNPRGAAPLYDVVSRTDPGFGSASFGLGRVLLAMGDPDGAVAALGRIPATSALYVQAQMEVARALVLSSARTPGLPEFSRASSALEAIAHDSLAMHQLHADVLEAALLLLQQKGLSAKQTGQLLGYDIAGNALRTGIEHHLRACARFALTHPDRIAWVDRANQARPWTLV